MTAPEAPAAARAEAERAAAQLTTTSQPDQWYALARRALDGGAHDRLAAALLPVGLDPHSPLQPAALQMLLAIPEHIVTAATEPHADEWLNTLQQAAEHDDARRWQPALQLLVRHGDWQPTHYLLNYWVHVPAFYERSKYLLRLTGKGSREPAAALRGLVELRLPESLQLDAAACAAALIGGSDEAARLAVELAETGWYGAGSILVRALGWLPGAYQRNARVVVEELLHNYREEDGHTLLAALEVSAQLGVTLTPSHLEELVTDLEPKAVRLVAIRAIPHLATQPAEATRILGQLLAENDGEVRRAVFEALVRLERLQPAPGEPSPNWGATAGSGPGSHGNSSQNGAAEADEASQASGDSAGWWGLALGIPLLLVSIALGVVVARRKSRPETPSPSSDVAAEPSTGLSELLSAFKPPPLSEAKKLARLHRERLRAKLSARVSHHKRSDAPHQQVSKTARQPASNTLTPGAPSAPEKSMRKRLGGNKEGATRQIPKNSAPAAAAPQTPMPKAGKPDPTKTPRPGGDASAAPPRGPARHRRKKTKKKRRSLSAGNTLQARREDLDGAGNQDQDGSK